MRVLLSLIVLSFALTACEPEPDPFADTTDDGDRVELDSVETVAILDFLNDPATDFDLLDVTVDLDARAADAIISHRDGPDGLVLTADDAPFSAIQEVDDCYYVGTATLTKILNFALNPIDPPALPDGVQGVYDDVPFTPDEAKAVLDIANGWSEVELDLDVGLDQRAVDSILSARPVPSVEALSELYYVGEKALLRLKHAAHRALQDDRDAEGFDTGL